MQDLAQKLYSTNSVSSSARFQRPKLSQTAFTIQHYAGPVTYQTDNFLDKNKDFVVAEHQQLLQESTSPFTRELFAPDPVGCRRKHVHVMRFVCNSSGWQASEASLVCNSSMFDG
jgi:myosin heavy subunit